MENKYFSPEEYPKLESIYKRCLECGEKFEINPGEQTRISSSQEMSVLFG
jgi:hypothetical protein